MKKKMIIMVMALCLLSTTVFSAAVYAEEAQDDASQAAAANTAAVADVQDNVVTTSHTAVISGEELAYTATVGTMVVETGGEQCEFFYRAYTKDDVEDTSTRPVTFAFNGGPGSCSYYLEMGCLGPRRADMTEEGYTKSLPPEILDNENSLLDITDLVFIDAIGTGYSRPLDESKLSEFIGYDNDIRSFGDFINQYLNRNKRYSSKKYIAGESYGTTRAVGICKYLQDTYALNVNGLILISTLNDFSTVVSDINNDLPYALYFPTFAADAWYHKMLGDDYQAMELEDYLAEVKEFVSTEYVPALFRGYSLSDEDRDQLAEKISMYLGLPRDHVLSMNLRIDLEDFCSTLLKDQNLMIGRLDGRYAGAVTEGSLDDGSSDPSSVEGDLIFGNTFYTYLTEELDYQTDRQYIPANSYINVAWTGPASMYVSGAWIGGYFPQEGIIHDIMSKNPYLKIWVICGYYDGATPYYGAEWTYDRVELDEESRANLSFTYYPSGHMIYLEKESFDQFRKDAQDWYTKD